MTASHSTDRWIKYLQRTACACGLGLAVLTVVGPGSASAADDDEDSIWSIDKKLYNGLMRGLGLPTNTNESIEYRERSPLVVPPARSLPPPQANAIERNPAWPVDPDIKRQRAAKAKKNDPEAWDRREAGAQLTPSELNPPGSRRPTGTASRTGGTGGTVDADERLSPSQLGHKGFFNGGGFFDWVPGRQKQEVGVFTGEPPRNSLIAPPTGYQTPSPSQPYGVTPRREPAKPDKVDPSVGAM